MPNLAISLHAPDDALRGELVPINRKYGVAEIIAGLQAVPAEEAAQRITFEIRPAGGRQRLARGCAAAGQAAGRRQVEGEPDSAQRGGQVFRSNGPSDEAIDRFGKILAERGSDGLGSQEPRTRHPRCLRSALIVEGGQAGPPLKSSAAILRHDAHTDPPCCAASRFDSELQVIAGHDERSVLDRQRRMGGPERCESRKRVDSRSRSRGSAGPRSARSGRAPFRPSPMPRCRADPNTGNTWTCVSGEPSR